MSHTTRRSLSLPISSKNNIQRRLSDNGMYKYWYESQMITDTLVYLMILRRNYISNMFHIGLHDIKILGQGSGFIANFWKGSVGSPEKHLILKFFPNM